MPATVEYSTTGTIVSPWPPSTKAVTSSTETLNSSARKWRKRALVEHAGHADDHVVRQAGEFAQRPDHRVERVGDADDEGVRARGCLMPSPTAFITLRLMPSRSSRLMPGLRGDAGGDDADVGAGDVGIVVGALELRVEAVDRAGLGEVERLALRARLRRRRTGRCRPAPASRRGGRACRRSCRRRSARFSCEPWGRSSLSASVRDRAAGTAARRGPLSPAAPGGQPVRGEIIATQIATAALRGKARRPELRPGCRLLDIMALAAGIGPDLDRAAGLRVDEALAGRRQRLAPGAGLAPR